MRRQESVGRDPRTRWWQPTVEARAPSPLFTLRLWGLARARADIVLTVALLLLLAASRWAAFPATVWDQDEAYFTAAVVHFNPLTNQPHPPWFPLWILVGKALASLLGDPARGLQLASAVLSVWVVFPLTSLWSKLLRRPLAVAAAALYCALPGVWLLSGRAYSGPAATALLALAAAAWFAWENRAARVLGSLAAGAAVLVRPHFVVAALPLLALALVRHSGRRQAMVQVLAPAAAMVTAGFAWVLVVAGGPGPLLGALEEHGAVHFSQLAGYHASFAGLGLARALVTPLAGAAWIALAAIGVLVARRSVPGTLAVVAAVLVPLGLLVTLAADPEHTRYWLPLLAFSSGLVVLGAARLLGRRVTAAVLFGAAASCGAVVFPALPHYRTNPSPAVAATRFAFARARARGSVVVADHTLDAFVVAERAERPFPGTVILDSAISRGETVPPPAFATVYLHAAGRPDLLERAEAERTFRCAVPLVQRIEGKRFLEVEVDTGAELR